MSKIDVEPGVQVDEEILKEMGLNQEEPKEEPEVVEEEQTEEEKQEEVINEEVEQTQEEKDQYKGKTREELIEMVENGTKAISRKGNEVSDLKKRLEALEAAGKLPEYYQAPKQKDEIEVVYDEVLAKYDKEDIQTIEKLVDTRLKYNAEQESKKKQRQIMENMEENEKYWNILNDVSPDLADNFLPKIKAEAERLGVENTYHRKGWLADFVRTNRPKQTASNKADIVKKKEKAYTVGGSSSNGYKVSSGRKSQAEVDKMTPEQYLEYAQKDLGLNLSDN